MFVCELVSMFVCEFVDGQIGVTISHLHFLVSEKFFWNIDGLFGIHK